VSIRGELNYVRQRPEPGDLSHEHRGFSPVISDSVRNENRLKRFPIALGNSVHRGKATVLMR
jgi:hypothetical protein